MNFILKGVLFSSDLLLEGEGLRVLIRSHASSSVATRFYTWVDGSEWSVEVPADVSQMSLVRRDAVIVATRVPWTLMTNNTARWDIEFNQGLATMFYDVSWRGFRRYDHIRSLSGEKMAVVRHGWLAMSLEVAGTYVDTLPLIIAMSAIRNPLLAIPLSS